jgi:hypothetical protein
MTPKNSSEFEFGMNQMLKLLFDLPVASQLNAIIDDLNYDFTDWSACVAQLVSHPVLTKFLIHVDWKDAESADGYAKNIAFELNLPGIFEIENDDAEVEDILRDYDNYLQPLGFRLANLDLQDDSYTSFVVQQRHIDKIVEQAGKLAMPLSIGQRKAFKN